MPAKAKEAPKYSRPVADEAVTKALRAVGEARTWKMKKGSTVPDRWDGKEITIYVPKLGTTPEETWKNLLAYTGGNAEAVRDAFVAMLALAVQKGVKDAVLAFKDGTLADAQTFADTFILEPATRGKGDGTPRQKLSEVKAEAKSAKSLAGEMLAGLPEAERAKYIERAKALGIEL